MKMGTIKITKQIDEKKTVKRRIIPDEAVTPERLKRREVQRKCMNNLRFGKDQREKILERDNYECQWPMDNYPNAICGMTRAGHKEKYGYDLTIDHIDNN